MPNSPRSTNDEFRTSRSFFGTSPIMVILRTALDTTWRMFVPILGGLGFGILVDHQFGWSPVGVFSGLALGALSTIALISQQFISIKKTVKKGR